MKKRFLPSILILFIAIILFSTISFAEYDLNISRWLVDAKLIKNGDLELSEDITFNFNDDFNGVYRNIVLEKIDSIEDLSISEMRDGKEVLYSQVKSAKDGDKNKFTLKEEKNTINLKIFSPSTKEKKTFRLKYTLKNLAVKHSDTGELYYKFLGKENKTHIDYFSVNLQLPDFDKENIKIFAHGPKDGKIYFSDEKIKSEVRDLSDGEFVENRVLFPSEYIFLSEKLGTNDFNSILQEEKALEKTIKENLEKKEIRKSFFSKVSIYLSILATFLFVFLFYRFRRNRQVFQNMTSPYPDNITAAELSFFINKAIIPRAFLASLFELSSKGYMVIEELDQAKESKEYSFKRTSKVIENLQDHEVFLLDWIFKGVKDTDTISTLDLQEYRKKNSTQFYSFQSRWNKLVKNDLKSRNYYDSSAKSWGVLLMILSLIYLSIGIITFTFESIYGVFPLILGIGIFVYGIILTYRTNDKGYIQYKLWDSFKKEMETKSQKNIDIDGDKALIYAIALGIAMKNLDKFRTTIGDQYYPFAWGYLFFLTNKKGGSQFEDTFTNRFYGFTSTSSSTSSGFGAGGGFTGGGGGGAGGGGAGGF